ncbi:hypothetical protein GOODEAATRI_004820 [Goodea atripinnis]|uniref:Uncharacterized protein n=1 Tax=Goodea atripinnis TaxID=208336 RepID=A0ABV0MSB3_9TELE
MSHIMAALAKIGLDDAPAARPTGNPVFCCATVAGFLGRNSALLDGSKGERSMGWTACPPWITSLVLSPDEMKEKARCSSAQLLSVTSLRRCGSYRQFPLRACAGPVSDAAVRDGRCKSLERHRVLATQGPPPLGAIPAQQEVMTTDASHQGWERCGMTGLDPDLCSLHDILQYLQCLFGRAASTLKVHLAVISVNHHHVDGRQVGVHYWLTQFLRGARQLHPPRRRPALRLSAAAVHPCYGCGPTVGPAVRNGGRDLLDIGCRIGWLRPLRWHIDPWVLLHPQVSCVLPPGCTTTSWAAMRGMALGEICAVVSSAAPCTFARFYHFDVAQGSALVSAVLPLASAS